MMPWWIKVVISALCQGVIAGGGAMGVAGTDNDITPVEIVISCVAGVVAIAKDVHSFTASPPAK
jgi:hypothetical protein